MAKSKSRANVAPSSSPLDIEDFQVLPLGSLPTLLLGFHVPYDHFRSDSRRAFHPRFKRGREWRNVAHYTFNRQRYWIGTVVRPTEMAAKGIAGLRKEWGGQENDIPILLDDVEDYRVSLKRHLLVDCNHSFGQLDWNVFPVDIRALWDLTDETFPDNLDELVDWENGLERAAHGGKWNLVVLA